MSFDALILSAFDRKASRDWAHKFKAGSITFDAAVEQVTHALDEQWLEVNSGPGMTFANDVQSFRFVFNELAPPSALVDSMIERASGDYYAYRALRLLCQIGGRDSYPNLMAWDNEVYLELFVPPPIPKGPSKYGHLHRDVLLIGQVKQLELLNFKPTRSIVSKRHISGCDAVAMATHKLKRGYGMTYDAVVRVWRNREKMLDGLAFANQFAEAMVRHLERNGTS